MAALASRLARRHNVRFPLLTAAAMFLSDLSSWRKRAAVLPAAIVRALEALERRDLDALEPGRYPLDEEGMFLLIQQVTTQAEAATRPEAHRDHTDIQLVLSGLERFGIAPPDPALQPVQEMFEVRDIAFYPTPRHEWFVDLAPGQFAIFYPGDLHRPCVAAGEAAPVRKAVVKLHRRLLGL
ncbi:YhcH/YjgK/YiaL family protein [Niveibacterium microcysteis]|uniref:YhcH/YjgK/YiaL family protein n=1 Tax=Niveibacterium microcysteis TaxID=2811415 RepID=UPI001FE96C7E|nr:YhcH/YjgK/YiaL family protein [Niveibacterium microcysteis]